MPQALTNAIELAVGLACLIAAAGLRRRPGLRILAALFAVGGLAAVAHVIWALLGAN